MAKEKINFPDKAELKVMRKKLARTKPSYVLPKGSSSVDRAKYEICKQVLIYMQDKGLSQRELAAKMDIPETRVSEVVHYHIWKFTLDRLLSYLEKLNPKVVFRVA
jgi:predicted XRE-type DNA-binding protein